MHIYSSAIRFNTTPTIAAVMATKTTAKSINIPTNIAPPNRLDVCMSYQ